MDWDFETHNTQYLTHGIHTYPAKMVPQIAENVINEYGKNANILFDPFCGTGTTLLEAKLHNIHSIGSDLNPLARLIAKVKTTNIEEKTLNLYLENFHQHYFDVIYNFHKYDNELVPHYPNIAYWFSKKVIRDLTIIKNYINRSIDNLLVKNFFLVSFSQTIRDCSWQRNDEFKLYRMPEEKIRYFNPEVFPVMERILARNYLGLLECNKISDDEFIPVVDSFNSVEYIPKRLVNKESVDLVLTSPPYGDSSTTVAYGQFSAFANQWIYDDIAPRKLDKDLMGGHKAKIFRKFKSDALNDQINEISKVDHSRALEVVAFYRDYYKSIVNISNTVKPKGFVCYVVSNRTVRGIKLSTDLVTIDFFKANGFKKIEEYDRRISNKRLPRKNSSNGKKGNTTELMNKEYIIVMQRK